MLSASLYIIICTARNRLLMRVRRLREPRYLIGAIAGAAYFYFAVFRRMGRGGGRGRSSFSPSALLARYGGAAGFAGVGLLLLAALAWIVPAESGLLAFSEAETHLLVPAPVTRRQLLVYRLLRSQLPLLFGAAISAVFVPLAAERRLRFGVGMFTLLVTARVYFTGVTRARARLAASSAAERSVAWAPLAFLLGAITIVIVSIVRVHGLLPLDTPEGLLSTVGRAIGTWPSALVLWPFTAVMRPLFAPSDAEFFVGLALALVVLGCTVEWVLWGDGVFQQAPDNVPEPTMGRRGSVQAARARNVGWTLGLSGRLDTVFLWKNAMQSLRSTNLVSVLPIAGTAILVGVAFATARMSATNQRAPAAALAIGSLFMAAFAALLGPQMVRSDMRGDLQHLDVLKTWPVKPAVVIRGQLLWPTLALTLWVWFALGCATAFSAAAFPSLAVGVRLSLSAAALVLAPALVAAQLTVHNAVAVLFPAWIPSGSQRARGLDAMGQRLILLAGVIIVLVVMIGPGAIAGGILTFAFYRVMGPVSIVPAAAVCVAVVAVEIAILTELLGAAYDRIDLPQVERSE
ncbi:MAG: putative ABC exporter domain-containing protein [Acidobacteriota bacterium]